MRNPFVILMLCLAVVSASDAWPQPLDRALRPRLVHGVPSADFPSVGALLRGGDPDTAVTHCTGTMIGCETMLTAAHCVAYGPDEEFTVFLPYAGLFAVTDISLNPVVGIDSYRQDLAVLKLGALVSGIRPSRLNTLGAVPDGTPGVIVGYGLFAQGDLGIQHSGSVETAPCPVSQQSPPFPQPAGALCWFHSTPLGPPGSNSTICNGDSGGPLFADLGGGPMIAGVASGILRPDGVTAACNAPMFGVEARVDQFVSWIQTEGGPDLANTRCGDDLLHVGDAGTVVSALSGSVDVLAPESRHTVAVSDDTAELRVTMNGVWQFEHSTNDFDLYVKAGSPPTTVDFDCARTGDGQFAACTFAAPASGPWHVMVRRKSGAGQYQLTATAFGRDCAAPGTDGLACDDQNPCSTNDVCQGGLCTGSAVPDATPCDDGNQCSGDDACASGTCVGTTLADGTPCDDAELCSFPDACAAGMCLGASPAVGCTLPTVPRASSIHMKDDANDKKDGLAWAWSKGGATPLAALGDPTTTTDYALCVYDRVAGVPQRVLEVPVPAGAGWKRSGTGFKFKNDRDLSLGRIKTLTIKGGTVGKPSLKVKGKSGILGVPNLPLTKAPAVTMQLVNPLACWQADFGTSTSNDDSQFKARSD